MGKDTARRDFLIKTNELARDTNGEKSLEVYPVPLVCAVVYFRREDLWTLLKNNCVLLFQIISNIKNNRRDSWQSKPDGKKYGEMSEMRSIIGMATDPEFQEFSKNILSWNSKHTDKLDPMFSGFVAYVCACCSASLPDCIFFCRACACLKQNKGKGKQKSQKTWFTKEEVCGTGRPISNQKTEKIPSRSRITLTFLEVSISPHGRIHAPKLSG